jgi:hypothetical protein
MSVFRYLWAAPNTAVGLLLVPIVWASGGHVRIAAGVLELCGGALGLLLRRGVPIRGGVVAITLGHVVAAQDQAALDLTRAHERVHVRQCELWGPFFLPAYFLASLWAAANGLGAYRGNYFEQQARQLGNQ